MSLLKGDHHSFPFFLWGGGSGAFPKQPLPPKRRNHDGPDFRSQISSGTSDAEEIRWERRDFPGFSGF